MKKLIFLQIIIVFLATVSCKSIIGYQKIKTVDNARIEKVCKKYDVQHCVQLTKIYVEKVKENFADSTERHDLMQPLQAHYFVNGVLQSNLINCYAKGLFKLDWNSENRFDTFPPKSHFQFSKTIDLPFFENLINFHSIEKNEVVFIFWTNMLEQKSVDLIEIVTENVKKHRPNAQIILVNMDNLFVGR